MAETAKPKPKTRAELEARIAELEKHNSDVRVQRDDARMEKAAALEREKATRAQFDDLKSRLAKSEAANQRMRGYILRVQEDDVVREELVATGDPQGAQQLVPKRRAERFDEPTPYMVDLGRDGASVGYTDYRERDRPQPKHWVTY